VKDESQLDCFAVIKLKLKTAPGTMGIKMGVAACVADPSARRNGTVFFYFAVKIFLSNILELDVIGFTFNFGTEK
jgi:hypothetical protein